MLKLALAHELSWSQRYRRVVDTGEQRKHGNGALLFIDTESEDVLRCLSEHGGNPARGYWFSRRLPAVEFSQGCRQRLH